MVDRDSIIEFCLSVYLHFVLFILAIFKKKRLKRIHVRYFAFLISSATYCLASLESLASQYICVVYYSFQLFRNTNQGIISM